MLLIMAAVGRVWFFMHHPVHVRTYHHIAPHLPMGSAAHLEKMQTSLEPHENFPGGANWVKIGGPQNFLRPPFYMFLLMFKIGLL